MKPDVTFDLRNINLGQAATQTMTLVLDEPNEATEQDAAKPEQNFFDHLLNAFEEDPERWDGLE